MQPLPPRQLTMVIDEATVSRLLDVALPPGYVIRAPRVSDTASWTDTLQAGGFDMWTEEKVREYLEDAERREGSRVVEQGGRIVAGTFASRIPKRPPTPNVDGEDRLEEAVLDYVVTHPDHQGQGTGKGHLRRGFQVLHRPGVQDGLAGHRRLEAAGNPRLLVVGLQTGHEQERHAGPVG